MKKIVGLACRKAEGTLSGGLARDAMAIGRMQSEAAAG